MRACVHTACWLKRTHAVTDGHSLRTQPGHLKTLHRKWQRGITLKHTHTRAWRIHSRTHRWQVLHKYKPLEHALLSAKPASQLSSHCFSIRALNMSASLNTGKRGAKLTTLRKSCEARRAAKSNGDEGNEGKAGDA